MPSESPPAMAVTFPLPPRPSTVPPMISTVTQGHPNEIRESEDVTTMMENPSNRKISNEIQSIDNCNNQEIITTQLSIDSNQPSTSQAPPPQQPVKPAVTVLLDQERYLPIANVVRLMKGMMDPSAKLAKDAKECVQECVSEFISFIASEAAEICNQTRKKTIGADELLTAMEACGFDNYSEPMRIFLQKYRQAKKMSGPPHITHPNYVRPSQFAADPPVQPLFYETENGGTKCTEMEDPRAKNMIQMTMSNNDYIQHNSYQGTEDMSKGGHGGYVDDWNLHGSTSSAPSSSRIPPPGTTVILTGRGGDQDDEEEGGGVRRHLTQDEDGNIYEEVQLDEVSMHDYHQSNGHHLSHHHGHHSHNQIIDGMEEEIEEIVGGDHGGDGDDDDNQIGNAIALEQQQQMQIYIDPKSKQHYAAKETPNGMELYPLIIQNTPLHLENVTGASQYVLNLEDGSTGHVMIPDDSMPSTSSSYYHQNSPSTSSSSTSHHQNPTGRHLENQKAPKRRKPNYMSQEDSMGFRRPDDVNSGRQLLAGMGGATAPTRGNKKTPAKRRRS